MLTTPVTLSIVKARASTPPKVYVTAPIGVAPPRIGVGPVYGLFSSTLVSAMAPIVKTAPSTTSFTVTVQASLAPLPSASVAVISRA